ncbi:MAG: hypothetical protein SP1CHLAM54_12200 [Chlamydiia bacterium]|nr:hypothetical protein [Chlamydiia bacterium]MCH9616118.1 hypothetical protein [Chlamydiia bacterium]MCH9629459.1 hypothetical protein [Chlamydiia bacterium]
MNLDGVMWQRAFFSDGPDRFEANFPGQINLGLIGMQFWYLYGEEGENHFEMHTSRGRQDLPKSVDDYLTLADPDGKFEHDIVANDSGMYIVDTGFQEGEEAFRIVRFCYFHGRGYYVVFEGHDIDFAEKAFSSMRVSREEEPAEG